MKKQSWKTYAYWIVLTEGVGVLAGLLSRQGTEIYASTIQKPPLSPPGIVFPIAWSVLYLLMAVAAARVDLSPPSRDRTRGLRLYAVQLAFNFFWPLIFFNLQAFGVALIWLIALWLLILWMTLTFRRCDRVAALLQIPYLLWVAFAAYLNAGVWILNK